MRASLQPVILGQLTVVLGPGDGLKAINQPWEDNTFMKKEHVTSSLTANGV